jgi:hypothetical protein
MSKSDRKLDKYPDQPTATVVAEKRYWRVIVHPIVQAENSPSVA